MTSAILALVVACSSYGASDPDPVADAGTSTSSSGGAGDGGNPTDAAEEAKSYSEMCPPCGSNATCVPAGCSGAGTNVTCNSPYDVTASQSIVVFACPDGPTTPLPAQAACGGGGLKHGALLRLGNTPNKWSVTVQGQAPFLVTGDCAGNGTGGCSSTSVTKDIAPLLSIFVGTTTTNLTTCVQLNVTLQAQ